MAHKKAGGSSKNGRDSESKRLGVKRFGGEKCSRGTSSFANAARNIIRVRTSVSGATIPCTLTAAGRVDFAVKGPKSRRFVSVVRD